MHGWRETLGSVMDELREVTNSSHENDLNEVGEGFRLCANVVEKMKKYYDAWLEGANEEEGNAVWEKVWQAYYPAVEFLGKFGNKDGDTGA